MSGGLAKFFSTWGGEAEKFAGLWFAMGDRLTL